MRILLILFMSLSSTAFADEQIALGYNCKLIKSNGRSEYEKVVFATEGLKQAKLSYLNSLIVKKNGSIYEPDAKREDGFITGEAFYAPGISEVSGVECISSGIEINLGSNN